MLGGEIRGLDAETVRLLRHKMPAHSSNDAASIRQLMRSGNLFRRILDPNKRDALGFRLLECHRFVTLESFF